jgi:hypothetical protein
MRLVNQQLQLVARERRQRTALPPPLARHDRISRRSMRISPYTVSAINRRAPRASSRVGRETCAR